jgi:hypothetical protein
MNPLLTQKIEWGVKLKNEIVGEERRPKAGKGVDGSGSEERGIKTRLLIFTLQQPAHSATLPRFKLYPLRTDPLPQLSLGRAQILN